jgi:hypothetical protein
VLNVTGHQIVPVPSGEGKDPLERSYAVPPPQYEPIQGRLALENGVTHNLMTEFVNVSSTTIGVFVDIQMFAMWCARTAYNCA